LPLFLIENDLNAKISNELNDYNLKNKNYVQKDMEEKLKSSHLLHRRSVSENEHISEV
jgi:hypothetical protein